MQIRAACAGDIPAILAIYNHGIAGRKATFETRPRTADDVLRWIELAGNYPVLVAVGEQAKVLGWASCSMYRDRACYAGIAEFSVYVAQGAQGSGVGKQLLACLAQEAGEKGFWKLLSRVFTFNHASLAMCRAWGFREVGVYQKHAQLDGKWLDVVVVEKLIPENQPFVSSPGV